ncbi:MAG TPA: hypothetical protein VI385_05345 [Flavisolibacter sp.]
MALNKHNWIVIVLIVVLAVTATTAGIFSSEGPGAHQYTSIRGTIVTLYGKGLYRDMSAEVAPQGIAQDYVTLLIGIPLLIVAFFMDGKGSIRGKYLLTGVLGYFLVTYSFYTAMAMYNKLFLVYVGLLGTSFYSFLASLLSFNVYEIKSNFSPSAPFKTAGGFLMFIAVTIGLLWLSIIVPSLLNGTIVPKEVEHYTTLIVQGFDLGILLPGAFICGLLWSRKAPLGYLLTPVYFIFLSVLMTALTAKVIAMGLLGYNVMPVIFIIPTFNLATILCTIQILKSIREPSHLNRKFPRKVELTM